MPFERGIYLQFRDGTVGLVVGTSIIRTADGNELKFRDAEVEGIADWDDITRYRHHGEPKSSVVVEKTAAQEAEERLLTKYSELIEQFLKIADRKVSRLDEYGDEQMHYLPREVDLCIAKIAGREGLDELDIRRKLREERVSQLPSYVLSLRRRLPEIFRERRKELQTVAVDTDVRDLSGADFETHISKILRKKGFKVTGTPAAHDQGADLIAEKSGRRVVIQAKRYAAPVGNGAVQEVVAAVRYYDGTEGVVVTNSSFTSSARALAQKNGIKLIEGARFWEQLEKI